MSKIIRFYKLSKLYIINLKIKHKIIKYNSTKHSFSILLTNKVILINYLKI